MSDDRPTGKPNPKAKGPGRPSIDEMPEGERRATLLHVAWGLFRHRGYAAVSLADIAGEAGVTKATVLHHFGSKEALYAAVMLHTLGLIGGAVGRVAAGPEPAEAKLRRMAHDAIVWVDDDADLEAMFHDAGEHLSPDLRREIDVAHAAIGAGVAEVMRQGIAAGALADRDPRLLAHAFWTSIGGFSGRNGTQAGYQGRPEVADTVVDLFLHGAATGRRPD